MAKGVFIKGLICLGIMLFWGLFFLFGASAVVFRGPSPAARDLAVSTLMETSAAKFVVRLFLSEEEIDIILAKNAVVISDAVTDSDLVHIPDQKDRFNLDAITIEDVSGPTFKGKMMVVNDPARLYVATPAAFGLESGGLRVEEMVKRDGAAAGVNAGGFADENGVGNGGTPLGIVIQNGVLTFGDPAAHSIVIGFDRENKLVVGSMTGDQALARGVRDAVSFITPALIVNGKAANILGTGGGLNPRTAIGQRADGAVLLLVIDGRQAHSIGANYKDLIDVMLQYGAVNAANLDGGSSTLMVYNDEILNVCASLYGSRKLPTAILVKQVAS
ncbi:phosphodiester glycosidase family protein [Oscillospiraceae bacterium LTW-04]|nr:phosphodiester glycosidase family protein [Oscillospiraceae bacterium MB24-C1]